MIIQQFEAQVEKYAGKLAVVTEDRQLTYDELNREANRAAHRILENDGSRGYVPEPATAALLFEHSAAMIIGVIAALKAGKIYVPLDMNYPEKRLLYILEESEAALIITNNTNRELARKLAAKAGTKPTVIDIDALETETSLSMENIPRQPSGERQAYILYTSGSTGNPKGVVQNHENVLYYIRNWIQRFSLDTSDRMTLFSAFSHDGAGQDIFGALLSGAALYPYNILGRTTIAGITEWLSKEKITIWHSVPTLYRYFVHTLKQREPGSEPLPHLRFILLGGEQVRQHDLEMFRRYFPQTRLANVYGQTESSVSTIWTVKPGENMHRVLLGEPLDKTRIFLKDADGEIVEDIGTGEIYISSPHLALGYWKNPENTAKVFLQDPIIGPVYRTGDLGRLLGDGTIEFMGRKDTQLKIRGFRVETAEIESCLLKYEGIKEAVVIARADEKEEAQLHLCAYIVPDPTLVKPGEVAFPVSTLRNFLAGELPDYMIPSYFMELTALPVTASGKIDRKELPAPEPLRPQLEVTYAAPQTSLEKTVAAAWQEILNLDKVGIDDNFFDLGGTSFDILKIISRLHEVLKIDIPVVTIFRYPTVRLFSGNIEKEKAGKQESVETEIWYARRNRDKRRSPAQSMEIAVIGMAGRYPGSRNIEEYWDNLQKGRETITFFSSHELMKEGNEAALVENPSYVKANGMMEEIEFFDAAFFNYSPGEAEMMDPQLRILHECTWEALENAGYNPDTYEGLIGLYAGNSPNHYWVTLTYLNQGNTAETLFLNNNYSTKVSYKLNLQGPSVVVQTACSTSLTAIHLATQALLNHECDMALAGGVSIAPPIKSGYLYREGMILAPDGHCRAFAAEGGGTIFGDGVGIVVLKRKVEAIADGDTVSAIIKATAANNDGKRKVGVTAPSVEGQAEVIRAALELANLEPESIGYIETHGTGTLLGDTVEIEALKLAFNTTQKQYCALGSVKTNIGHLNSAAGVAGFIKTVLILKNRLIPATLHFETPNPQIDFSGTPFYINTGLKEWKRGQKPLRAGVSSFGLGGTNVHVILEEAPEEEEHTPSTITSQLNRSQLILVSARTRTALEQATRNLVAHIENHPELDLADIANTLQVGRKPFKHRKMLVCSTLEEIPGLFQARVHGAQEEKKPVIFMFPGIGAQYVNMSRELYETLPRVRREMDRCFEIVKPLVGYDLKDILYPDNGTHSTDTPLMSSISHSSHTSYTPDPLSNTGNERILQTEIAQLVLFTVEYALAAFLIALGIEPYAMIGYSFGEYAAACISGVLTLEDALKIVVLRGRLLQEQPRGVMLSVPAPVEEVEPLVQSNRELAIAIDNGTSCIVSGAPGEMANFEKRMKEKRFVCMRVNTQHAMHSPMMTPILEKFSAGIRGIPCHKPGIPYISNVTGTWHMEEDAMNPGYWATHLSRRVCYARGMQELSTIPGAIFIEVGPGRDLSALIRRYIVETPDRQVLDILRAQGKEKSDRGILLERIGRLWGYGNPVKWTLLHEGETRRRRPLPTYPFERERYWLEGNPLNISEGGKSKRESAGKRTDIAEWFYVPTWKSVEIPVSDVEQTGKPETAANWLVFMDNLGIGAAIKEKLERHGQRVTVVRTGTQWTAQGDNEYTLRPHYREDYDALLEKCDPQGREPLRIVHLWEITGPAVPLSEHDIEASQYLGYYSLIHLAQAIGQRDIKTEIKITAVTDGMQGIRGDDLYAPHKATVLGPLKVIPREYDNIRCQSIDIELSGTGTPLDEEMINRLWEELFLETPTPEVVYRARQRWEKTFEPRSLYRTGREMMRLKESGVYLITGGTGGMGLEIAGKLAETVKARLVLTCRSPIPPRRQWARLLKSEAAEEEILDKIKKIQKLEAMGAQVLEISADVADRQQMKKVVKRILEKWGAIDGVIHAAGVVDGTLIQRRTRETCRQVMRPKVTGALVLDELLKDQPLEFFILFSSMGAITAMPGQAAYCAANVFLDHFARSKSSRDGGRTISIDWDVWRNVGMAPRMVKETEGEPLQDAILPTEGVDVFMRILSGEGLHQVVVSTAALENRLRRLQRLTSEIRRGHTLPQEELSAFPKHSRPELSTPYLAPQTPTEQILVEIWQELLRIETVGTRDDFFELGGDSLKAITFAGRIHRALQVETPISVFFNKPTIKELADYLDENRNTRQFHSIPPVEKKQCYDLSSAQKRLFILQQMEPASTAYNLTSAMLLEGEPVRERLESVIHGLIARHESLRTSFHLVNGEPIQVVHAIVEFAIETFKEGNPIKSFTRPFELSQAPLMRVGITREGKDRYILILDMHHIVYDGESIQIFIKEFIDLYRGQKPAPLKIHYKDYSEWLSSRWNREAIQKQEDYWLQVFSGEIPVLELPLDYPRPTVQGYEGNRWAFTLTPGETLLLKTLAKESGITLFMILLGIINILLMKLSGQEDIVIGTPVTGREHPELEKIIGIFVSTVALRNQPGIEKTFREFLEEIKQSTLAGFENQAYPFETLVEKAEARRDTGRNPIFDIMLIMHNYEVAAQGKNEVEIDGIKLKKYEYEPEISRFDITFNALEINQTLVITIEYSTKLFKEETMKRYAAYIRKIVSTLPGIRDTRLGDIDILPTEERENLLYTFNRTETEIPGDTCYHQLFNEQVERTPHHIAISGPDIKALSTQKAGTSAEKRSIISITYTELNEKARQLACKLKSNGVKPGVLVGLLVSRSIDMVVGLLAILKAGGAYLPLDPEYPEKRIQYILKESNTGIILKDDMNNENNLEIPGTIIDMTQHLRDTQPPAAEIYSPGPAYVIYTSGSTGNPKGVMVSHNNVVNFIKGMSSSIGFGTGKAILAITTVSFDIFFLETLLPLTRGMHVVIASEAEQKDPALLEHAILNSQVNMIQFTPSRLRLLFDLRDDLRGLTGVEVMMVGGEAFPAALLEKAQANFLGKIYNMYGPTETTVWSAVKELTSTPPGEITIGNPIANTQIYIVGNNMQLQPLGTAGELLIGGEGVAIGYLNNIELTAARFLYTHWALSHLSHSSHSSHLSHSPYPSNKPYISKIHRLYKTGDLARWKSNRELEFLGRRDHQVKIRGYRVEMEEIEEFLTWEEHIKEAVVMVQTESSGESQLCAYIVLNQAYPSGVPDIPGLRKMLSTRLPQYMIPAHFISLEKIPLTPNGKIDRKALPKPELSPEQRGSAGTYVAPRTDNEKIIANIWKEILNLEEVGMQDNFFDLGGNSLQVIQLNWKLKEIFGKEIPIEVMFRNLSISFIDQYLSDQEKTQENKAIIEIKQVESMDKAHETLKDTISKLSGE